MNLSIPDAARVVPDLAITLWAEWAWMICILGPEAPMEVFSLDALPRKNGSALAS